MRYLACLFVVLAIPAVTLATDEPRFSPAEQEVLNVSQARRDASNRRDVAGSARYVAADCIFSSDDGVVITKAKYYERLAKLPVAYDRSTNAREFVVRLHGRYRRDRFFGSRRMSNSVMRISSVNSVERKHG